MEDQVRVQVLFEKTDAKGITFCDALYFSLPEYPAVSKPTIEQLKTDRYENWKISIASGPKDKEAQVDVPADLVDKGK